MRRAVALSPLDTILVDGEHDQFEVCLFSLFLLSSIRVSLTYSFDRTRITLTLTPDESSLEPLLSFAARYVSHPRYAALIVTVAHKVLDLYASVLGQSDSIDELFLKLHRQVKAHCPSFLFFVLVLALFLCALI